MAARPSWKGFIRLSLVSVPVEAYTASATSNEIHLRQLHRECNTPINYRKVCPIHGELQADDIVSGYEYAKGQFVIVDPNEMDQMRTEAEKSVLIDGFVEPGSVDPIYWSGKNYYLVPQGTAGARPYALLHRGMVDEERHAVAKVTMFGREHVVLLRPMNGLIVMSSLSFTNLVKQPDEFMDKIESPQISNEEIKLARTLIHASEIEKLDLTEYKDHYAEKLHELIDAKVAGQQIVAPAESEPPKVIDLMDALKQSLAQAQGKAEPEKKKMAPSARGRGERKQAKRKSG